MPEILCPNCGKENPDFFDACQFCQTPLHPEDTLHAGDAPSEKDTGELEQILPEWLQDARQQNRDAEDAETFSPDTQPRIQTTESVDLLAGLASQGDSDEEDDVPDWLAAINPVSEDQSSTPSDTDEEESSDFFAQFSQAESQPSLPVVEETEQESAVPSTDETTGQDSAQTDELAGWLSQAPTETDEPFAFNQGETNAGSDDWINSLGSSDSSQPESPVEKEPEDLSWLHDLEATAKEKETGSLPSPQTESDFDLPSAQPESSGEDLSWLNELGGTPVSSTVEASPSQPASSEEDLGWLNNLGSDQLPTTEEHAPAGSESSDENLSWLDSLGDTQSSAAVEESMPAQPQSSQGDLDWLNDLGSEQPSTAEEPASAQLDTPQGDLDWLNNLGETQSATAGETGSAQPESSQEDLSWLNDLGNAQQVVAEESVSAQPESSLDDLDWMKNLGDTRQPAVEEAASAQSESSTGDLDWLNNLGDVQPSAVEESAPAQSESPQDDLDWMKSLGDVQETSAAEIPDTKFTPPGTKPLDDLTAGIDTTPDWLKSAMEEPSMPALDELSMGWRTDQEESTESEMPSISDEMPALQSDETHVPVSGEPDSALPNLDLPFGDSSTSTSQDVDAMFSIDLPDMASQETGFATGMSAEATSDSLPSGDEDLAPVELPSWVQAMRPVDSAIGAETSSDADYADQTPESEGPLAGFSGVIPSAPIGSSLRPKALSLKLQVTEEQQAGASLIEQIIASETTAPSLKLDKTVASQRALRWALSILFLVVLSLVLGFGQQKFPVSASGETSKLSNLIGALPDDAPVLLVMDYEPAVAGELAAAAGPVLDQLAASRHATFIFISTSPTSSAMVEALMSKTKINRPVSDNPDKSGLEYQAGIDYFNAGFLPGGSAGVLGFIDDPVKIMPNVSALANVTSFSDFEAVILLTDNADTGRVWIEQLEFAKQTYPDIAGRPLVIVSSAQAGPILKPYISSGQVDIMINGLSDAAQYEYINQSRPGIARRYWDAFAIGLMIAVLSIVLGSIWSIIAGIRERRAEAEQG